MTHGPDFLAQKLNTTNRRQAQGRSPSDGDTGAGGGGAQGKGWMRCAKLRTPKAYEEVRLALMNVEMDMPPERRTDWTVWDGRVQPWHYTASRMDNSPLVRPHATSHKLSSARWVSADVGDSTLS